MRRLATPAVYRHDPPQVVEARSVLRKPGGVWWMMSVNSFGVDAPFVDGVVTPFVSESSRIFSEVEKEISQVESSKSLLEGPSKEYLGPEKGRLDRLHAEYITAPSDESLNRLLGEVERYARRVTLGKGGKYAQRLNYSTTDQYPQTEISRNAMVKVWRKLDTFDGKSKFSVWVFRIARNTVKDAVRQIRNRAEVELLDWKDYGGEYAGSRGASAESTDGEFEIRGGSKTPLPDHYNDDDGFGVYRAALSDLVAELPGQDQRIIEMYCAGDKPAEIGKAFGKNAKWASNQLTRIKATLIRLAKEAGLAGVANRPRSNVIAMKGRKTLPASQAAD